MKFHNLVEMVQSTVDKHPDKAAFMWKSEGSYRSITYRDFWQEVKSIAAGLAQLGVEKDDKVGIISENNQKWPVVDLAVMSLGAAGVPVYPNLPVDQVTYTLKNAECKVAIVEDQDQLDKVQQGDVEIGDIVVIEPPRDFEETDHIFSFFKIANMGTEKPLDNWEAHWRDIDRDQLATIVHTSGTTGNPKGAVITHGNILANIEGVQFWVVEARSDDTFLSYLPLSHIFERMAGHFMPMSVGATVAYAQSIDTIPENLQEIKPTVMTSVPLLFEKVYAQVQEEIGGGLKKKIFDWAIRVGNERYDYYLNTPADRLMMGELPPKLRKRWRRADKLVYQKVKTKLGGRLRALVSGGGALNPEIGRFLWAIDVPVLEGYGLTETSPVIAANPMTRTKIGTVGKPLPNLEVKTAPDGEVLVKGPSIMKGYYKNEKATAKEFEGEWFRTGDLGEIDEEGYLKIVDRKKRIIVLTTGKNIAPQPVENAMSQSVYIDQSVLIGQNRKYVIALAVPSFEYLKPWANKKGLSEDNADLVRNSEVQELLCGEIERFTKSLAHHEQPKKVVIIGKEWTVETNELTPSLKVRLPEIERKYKEVIDRVYAEDRPADVEIAADEIAASVDVAEKKKKGATA